MTNPITEDLTDAQLEAVTHLDGPMLVVAGAGSGKTRVVTRRIAWLVSQGIRPHQILAMTFTNKAAREMKERVEQLVGEAPRWVGTFHSACARFLRFDLDKLNEGRDSRFSIFDQSDQEGLIKQCLKEQNVTDKRFTPRTILPRISRAKCDFIRPDEFGFSDWDDEIIAKVYESYEQKLRKQNAVDFDDLLILTVRMLDKLPELRSQYQHRFRYILIDEYQDTNRTQYKLMRLLTGDRNNVHATGDPDQSIYSWRGAEYRNIMDFQKDFPDARVVRLEQNYRSTKAILAVANSLISNNKQRIEKSLFTENPDGEMLTIARLGDERGEAEWISRSIAELKTDGRELGDTAVFYRTNAQSRALEEALMSAGIPYQIVGGIRFYERKEIKDILAHCKILVNPKDTVSLARVIGCRPTGVGVKTFENILASADKRGESPLGLLSKPDFASLYEGRMTAKLKSFAAWCEKLTALPQKPVGDCIRRIIETSGLISHLQSRTDKDPANEDRLENLNAFLARAMDFEKRFPDADLAQFMEEVALVADIDGWQADTDRTSLMTLHSAKGLEFDSVFITGVEHGLLPHRNSRTEFTIEEERRLLYVGITRGMQQVALSYVACRFTYGQSEIAEPSPFLAELPEENIQYIEERIKPAYNQSGFGRKRQKPPGDWDDLDFDLDDDDDFPVDEEFDDLAGQTPSTLKPGAIVIHPTFGKGKVLSLKKHDAVVQFFTSGIRMLHLDACELKVM